MSAVNLIIRPDRAWLLCDGARYLANGVVVEFADKCTAIPKLHCAMSVLGPVEPAKGFIAMVEMIFTSFDELVERIGPIARVWFEGYEQQWVLANLERGLTPKPTLMECWFVGFSQARRQCEAFTLALGAGQPFVIEPVLAAPQGVGFSCNPILTPAEFLRLRLPWDGLGPDNLLEVMEIQRRQKLLEARVHIVGGYALLTSVTAEGVEQRVIHRWIEDKVGELIRPIDDKAAQRVAALKAKAPAARAEASSFPCLAMPGLAWRGHAPPRRASPRRAVPGRSPENVIRLGARWEGSQEP